MLHRKLSVSSLEPVVEGQKKNLLDCQNPRHGIYFTVNASGSRFPALSKTCMPFFHRIDQVCLRECSFFTSDECRNVPNYVSHLCQSVQYAVVVRWSGSYGTRIWYKYFFVGIAGIAIGRHARSVRLLDLRRYLESQSAGTVRQTGQ